MLTSKVKMLEKTQANSALMKLIILKKTAIILIAVFLFNPSYFVDADERKCSYSTYRWNVHSKKSVMHQKVVKDYSKLNKFEIDKQTGCSVCKEDQVELKIGQIKPFKVCKLLADQLQYHLTQLNKRGRTIKTVVGYRVGMTRGVIDRQGNRTQFSNHSFGIAIDINEQQNGLYDQCIQFNNHCRLIRGGMWDRRNPLSLTKTSRIVNTLKQIGFKWGGEIQGKQKDFMHFSPTGY